MTADPIFFRDLAYVFVAAVLGGALAWATRQPLILGYVLGGILVSPFTPGPAVSDVHTFELFAEIGVVLLMFSVGIEFSLRDLLRVKWVAVLGGPLGILLSVALGALTARVSGWPAIQGIVIGIVVSVASTMVLARLLLDRGELHTRHGRVMIGITLVEDLAVVILTVLLPFLGNLDASRLLDLGLALGKAALVLIPVGVFAARIVPPLMARVARTRSEELFLLVSLAIGLGTAALTQAVGLSLALGAFLAGLVINESDYAHETLARLLPIRDAFVALFFVTIGAVIEPRTIFGNLPLLGVMVALITAGKLTIWTGVVWLFRYPLRIATLVGLGLTQIGEFSFVLVQVARSAGHVGPEVYNATLAASLLTILLNALVTRSVAPWIARGRSPLGEARRTRRPAGSAPEKHVVLCGFGRVGGTLGEALETFSIPYTVVEVDPEIVRSLGTRGIPCVLGDASRRRVLEDAGVGRAALVVVALPETDRARGAVRTARAIAPAVPILARLHERSEVESLRVAGATEVIQPELEASATLIRHTLQHLAVPKETALAYLERLRQAMETVPGRNPEAPAPLPEVREFTVEPDGLADQSLGEARVRERFGVTILAITRAADGATLYNPPAETIVRAGDRLRVFGLPSQMETFASALRRSA